MPATVYPSYEAAGLSDAEADRYGGRREKYYTCPSCSAERKHKNDKCLNVNFDKSVFRCNHCDFAGRLRSEQDEEARQRREAQREEKQFVAPKALRNNTAVSDRGLLWFEQERGIPRAVVERYDIREETLWMPKAGREAERAAREHNPNLTEEEARQVQFATKVPTLLFPYTRGGELVNIKYRARDEKDFRLHKNAELIFFGLDDLKGETEAYLVEGEMDKLAYAAAGIFNVVSVPNGSALAKEELLEWQRTGKFDNNRPLKLDYLDNSWDDLAHIETWYLSTDTDAAGLKLRAEMVRRLGPESCRFINHPAGCKDANDVLRQLGPDSLRGSKANATKPPVDGALSVDDVWDALSNLIEHGVEKGLPLGISEFADHYSFKLGSLEIITGTAGDGKCLAKGTKVMLYSGRIVNVEDVRVGDRLMGPDSTPRNVLSLARGREQMYWVRQKRGEDYRVNESHILTLQRTESRRWSEPHVIDISVRELLTKGKTFLKEWKGFKAPGVEYAVHQPIGIDPYYLGLWLGDGATADSCRITNVEPEINAYVADYANNLGLLCKQVVQKNRTPSVNITGGKYKGRPVNTLRMEFQRIELEGRKHVPDAYLYATRENRLALLAGLIDTDGSYNGRMYEITQKNQAMARQIVQLSRGLGFYTSFRNKVATMKRADGTVYSCEVTRVLISGNDMSVIPCRVARKKAQPSPATRPDNALVTGITLEKDVVDDYYGFAIDGDRRFLLGDLTVTHNTTIVKWMMCLTAMLYDWRWAIFSPENYPEEKMFAQLLQVLAGKPFVQGARDRLSAVDLAQWRPFLRDHFFVMDANKVDTPESLIDRCEQLVARHGINAVMADPWNSFKQVYTKEDNGREDIYITRILSRFRDFNRRYNCSTFLLAHPKQMQRLADGSYPVATARDISGGPAFWNRADTLWTVHRRRTDANDLTTDIYFWKIKFNEEVGVPTLPGEPVTLEYESRGARFHGFASRTAPECFYSSVPGKEPVRTQAVYAPKPLPLKTVSTFEEQGPAPKEAPPAATQELIPF